MSEPAAAHSKTARPDKAGGNARTVPNLSRVRATASAKPAGGKAVAKKAPDKASDEAAAFKKGKKRASARKKG